jgi:microcystin-dependent protein
MSEAYAGTIMYYPIRRPEGIAGYLPCEGQVLQVTQNQALFAVIGNAFGGDGIKTFSLPDLRSKMIVGVTQAATGGTVYQLAEQGGAETVGLTTAALPEHTHRLSVENGAGNNPSPAGTYLAEPGVAGNSVFTSATTPVTATHSWLTSPAGAAHPNIAPFGTTCFYICVKGYFPPRQ